MITGVANISREVYEGPFDALGMAKMLEKAQGEGARGENELRAAGLADFLPWKILIAGT